MLSTRSGLPASPEVRRPVGDALRRGWPTLIVLPVLVMVARAATISPLIMMFLGPDFGLSGGREAPWPWALAIIGTLGFWAATLLGRNRLPQNAVSALLVVLAVGVTIAWWALEPTWDAGALLRDPISLVRGNGHLIIPLFLSLGFWIWGARWGFDPGYLGPEPLRENVRNSIIALALIMALAAIVGGDLGDAGISAGIVAVPILLVCSAGAIAAAEMESTRQLAAKRHTTAPGWDRWARTAGGTGLFLLLIVGVGALFLGPGALELFVDALGAIWTMIATVILWIMYAVVYVVYYVYRFIAWIVNSIFGDIMSPAEMPSMEGVAGPQQEEMLPPEPTGESEYATLLRWIGLGIALFAVVAILFVLSRRRSVTAGEGAVEEERSSIFSAALARKQLRDLFRRKPRPPQPRRLDLDRDPSSVRESMLYLQVLAARQGVPRGDAETPHDFADRLALQWTGAGEPLRVLRDTYERVRYGETDEDRRAAVDAWRQVWTVRKDVVLPTER